MNSTKTARDLYEVVRADLRQIRGDLSMLHADVTADLRYLRADLRVDLTDLADHLRADFDAWRDRQAMRKLGLCGSAPSGPDAPRWWRCTQRAGHYPGSLHQTEAGSAWDDRTFTAPAEALPGEP